MKTPRGYSFVVSFILVGIMTGCALTQFFMQHNMLGSVLWGIAALTWLIKGLVELHRWRAFSKRKDA